MITVLRTVRSRPATGTGTTVEIGYLLLLADLLYRMVPALPRDRLEKPSGLEKLRRMTEHCSEI
jgi:hypothetical protein